MRNSILIVDFGSQVTKLIARRIRELGIYCQIKSFDKITKVLFKNNYIKGIIFSGGPSSVENKDSPNVNKFIYELQIPILGICYGLQLLCKNFGGKVKSSEEREFGKNFIKIKKKSVLFEGIYDVNKKYQVWMSHGDVVTEIPNEFESVASSEYCDTAAIQNLPKKFFGVQFHPEVVHTPKGGKILKNFVLNICHCSQDWNMKSYKDEIIKEIKNNVEDNSVICGLSGGVDSTVTAVLLNQAIGDRLKCIFVNTGLMRKNEVLEIKNLFTKHFNISLTVVNDQKIFFEKLKGVSNPEKKRKIIGRLFISSFERFAKKVKNVRFLAQGTLYPDIIESLSAVGNSKVVIKSHHNVGGLPEKMKLELIEPLKDLFKDEVRKLGSELKIPKEFLNRHPFPGPGLAIRVLGQINKQNISILQKADDIFINKIKKEGLYDKIWQAFCVLLPVKTVGVMGDNRTYEKICVLRAVTSTDGMTAETYKFNDKFLKECSNDIVNKVSGINRVCYDYTSKPPGTIEYE